MVDKYILVESKKDWLLKYLVYKLEDYPYGEETIQAAFVNRIDAIKYMGKKNK